MTNTEMIALVALGMNAGAIIWGAAKMAAAIENLKDTVKRIEDKAIPEIKEIAMEVSNKVHGLIARVYIIEDRLGIEYRSTDNLDRQ